MSNSGTTTRVRISSTGTRLREIGILENVKDALTLTERNAWKRIVEEIKNGQA